MTSRFSSGLALLFIFITQERWRALTFYRQTLECQWCLARAWFHRNLPRNFLNIIIQKCLISFLRCVLEKYLSKFKITVFIINNSILKTIFLLIFGKYFETQKVFSKYTRIYLILCELFLLNTFQDSKLSYTNVNIAKTKYTFLHNFKNIFENF